MWHTCNSCLQQTTPLRALHKLLEEEPSAPSGHTALPSVDDLTLGMLAGDLG